MLCPLSGMSRHRIALGPAIPQDTPGQRTATTPAIERPSARQRLWCGHGKRQSSMRANTQEPGDLPLALVVQLWAHGNEDEFLSLRV
jgi:hypothetical protein